MSLVMVVTMAGFLFVFVITVTFFYLISGESIQEGVACITEECLKARKYLDGVLNETKDPCVDIYGYVCDSWHQKGISFHAASVLSQLFRLNLTLFHKREEFCKDEQRQGMHILGPVYRQVPPVSSGHLWLKRDNVTDALQLLVDIDAAVKKFFAGKEPIEKQQTLQATVNDMVANVSANDWVAAVSDSHRHTLVLVPTDEIVVKGAEIFRPAMQDTTRSQATETISKTALDVIAGEAFNVSRVDYTGPEPPLDESASFLNMLATALRHHHNVMAANPPTRMEMHISDLEF
ncbi:hypothetical protein V5799_016049 [Amblyomma americanum]|uniref:Peptidase M13 N-terminal domain-containing protein n=1 Tax=Amblyomma americanum TaxID=6943 RepID=A0AAQ4F6X2_AMBAM